MKLPFAAALLALVLLACPGEGRGISGLEAYVGKDLRQLDAEANSIRIYGYSPGPNGEEFIRRFRALTGDKPDRKGAWGPFYPWWVDRFGSGKAEWMVLEAYPGYNVPDVSGVRVHIFDPSWKRVVKQTFPTGYRFFLREAKVSSDNPLRQDLLVTVTDSAGPFIAIEGEPKRPAFEQGMYQRQYYALVGDRLAMVRLEDDEGRIARNNYRWSAPSKGPPVTKRTALQWLHCLRSPMPAEQLAALVWLSGYHLSSKEPRYKNVNQESVSDSRRFEAVRDSLQTRKAVARLTHSKNRWVREYALLALHPPEE